MSDAATGPIGVFDSGYGGLTVFKEIRSRLPQYDYIYLGDNARSPYGTRSFETVYQYTLQAVNWFFNRNCPLVILACNTASAKALRSIQQSDLPNMADPSKRVLGVIRPTSELIGSFSTSKHIGILATRGTVNSESYTIEVGKFWPDITVHQHACPMWVPLVENNELDNAGSDFFIQKDIDRLIEMNGEIDTVLLACTHYPLLLKQISKALPENISVLSQGSIVADSLANYLERHSEMEERISKRKSVAFFTTDDALDFEEKAALFYGEKINAQTARLPDEHEELLHNF